MRCLPCLALVAAWPTWTACGAEDDDRPTGPLAYTATHYDYRFDLTTRAAEVDVTLAVTAPGDCLDIGLRAEAPADIRLDGEPATGQFAGGVLTACGPGWNAGDEVVLSAAMTVALETWEDSQVGYSVGTDVEGNPFHYLVSWVGGCDRFGPCDAAPDRFARYAFEVTHPAGMQVLCPGAITPGATVTTCAFEHAGGPTYSTFGLAASPSWVATDLGDWGGVRATLHDAPSSGTLDRLDAARHRDFLAWMVERFGPYPYGDELRLFTGPTYWSGFEHPGTIALNDTLVAFPGSAYARPLEHITNHEIAHQWAGDQTTLADTYDFVWKEAMAEYLSFAFEHETEPDIGLRTARAWRTFASASAYYPVPGERPELLHYYGDVYGPGPMILFRQVEAMFGRDAVIEALQSVLGAERALSVEDVRAALEQATGADFATYFDRWVFGEGAPAWPQVTIDVADAGAGAVTATATQLAADGAWFGMAFPVRLLGAAGETHDVWLDFGVDGAEAASATATPGFAVTDWDVDPDAYSLVREASAAAAPPTRFNPWVAR
jgi:aminopeptidase N